MRPSLHSMTLVTALVAAGCTVGPNYKGPPSVSPPATFVRAEDSASHAAPVARWWTGLNDATLTRLVEQAIANSPTVDVARARVREARVTLRGQQVSALPNTGTSAAFVRTRNITSLLGGGGGGGALNLYALGFDATWELDLFGANRRAVEGARAAAEAADANLADVDVTLSAEVAAAYIQLRDAQQRLALMQRSVDIDSQLLAMTRTRQSSGTASTLDVERMNNQLMTSQAGLAPLRASINQQLDRLAVLTGRTPGTLDADLSSAQATPAPPETVTVGDPTSLLQRRPDILAAERRLAQQTAAIGQQEAALFPKINLLGELGFASTSTSALFSNSNFSYAVAPILQWSPWDFGRTRAKINKARASRDEAEANYRQTVLSALEDAEDSLSQYGEQRSNAVQLAQARDSAERVFQLTQIRMQGGTAATIDVLDADTRRVQAELSYEQSLAQLSLDYVALQKSLGMGWSLADAS